MDRVLIVDDALDLGRLWQTALRAVAPSLNIMVVPSAEEALLEANYHKIDLLLTDIRLPGMDGIELVGRMRRLHPEMKVILVTGIKDANHEDSAKKLKVQAFFEKPFDLEVLLDKVTGLLGLENPGIKPLAEQMEPEVALVSDQEKHLSDILMALRQELGALAVILLDQDGKIRELCGELPVEDFESKWTPHILAVLRAGDSLSSLLGKQDPENILAFSGKSFDLMLTAPVGKCILVSILKSGRTAIRPAVAFEATTVARPELIKALAELGLDVQSEEPAETVQEVELVENGAVEEDLADLLSRPEEVLRKQDVDAFWEESPEIMVKSGAKSLSYEEAKKRGLTPRLDK